MNLTDKLNSPGEHTFTFIGANGQLEAALTVPNDVNPRYIAIVGHPHSLQGGTMHNKVVTTLTRAFKDMGIASLRFNFRGVGESAGVYDDGFGESEDMLILAKQCLHDRPDAKLIFAGFSFGSYVTYRAAAQCQHALLISVAPPVHHFDYTEFSPKPALWIVLQGDVDEVVPMSLVQDFIDEHPGIQLLNFADTGHFFHGKLLPLKERLIEVMHVNDIN